VRGAVASTFFHELGHGLVDAWQIPITGKEEDAVDQLSTLVLIRQSEEGERMALDAAVSFKLYADRDKGWEHIYWDEHSLDEQRFYDTICLVYGHDPEKYTSLVQDGTLPRERAELCTEDYPKIAKSWESLLKPYLKQPPRPDPTSSPK
jgi:Putative metallopeptidase